MFLFWIIKKIHEYSFQVFLLWYYNIDLGEKETDYIQLKY